MDSRLFSVCIIVGLTLVGGALPSAGRRQPQTAVAAPNVDALGPKVGDTLPAFTLQDQQGRTRPLSSLMGPKGAVLVFFRSADW